MKSADVATLASPDASDSMMSRSSASDGATPIGVDRTFTGLHLEERCGLERRPEVSAEAEDRLGPERPKGGPLDPARRVGHPPPMPSTPNPPNPPSHPPLPLPDLPLPDLPRGAGRFAPTPTGHLHLGNARTALLDHLATRAAGLRCVLRVEDLDPVAMPDGVLEGQYADLEWLGLRYDESPRVGGPVGPYRQSERYAAYAAVLRALDALGLLYPCWCSRKEVREAARAPHASDEGPVYAGTCKPKRPRPLGDLDALPERRGRVPALRLDVAGALARLGIATLTYDDLLAGPQRFDMVAAMGDFVVRRVDGIAAYQIACSWDDVAMACTQVVRGADLIPSTARQLLVLRTLGLPEPRYAHVGLVVDPAGRRLAKRDADISLGGLRAEGVSAGQVVRLLARISGLPDTDDIDALVDAFDLATLEPSDVRLPPDALRSGGR